MTEMITYGIIELSTMLIGVIANAVVEQNSMNYQSTAYEQQKKDVAASEQANYVSFAAKPFGGTR